MPEQDYSKREIDILFGEIKDILIRIEAQTTKTNGRVSRLEDWKNWIKGGAAVTTVVAAGVISLIVYVYTKDMDILNTKIDTHITQSK